MFGFCSIALRTLPFVEAVDLIAGAGFREIEVWHRHIDKFSNPELQDLKTRADDKGVRFSVLSPYFSFTRGEESVRESLQTAEQVLQAADRLGIPKIRTFVDCGPDGLPSAAANASHWDTARRGLRALCDLDPARAFVVETHGNTLTDSLPTTLRLFEEVDRDNLRINFQPIPDFFERGLFTCLETLWPRVDHMHWQQIQDNGGHTYVEEPGLVDFSAIYEFLCARAYTGTVSVEYCWPQADPARVATAWRFLRSLKRPK